MSDQVVLEIQCYDWASNDRDDGHSIRAWAHTKDGPHDAFSEQVLLRIEDYEPFCRIELPSVVEGNRVRWSEPALRVYVQWLKNILHNHAPTRINYQELEKLYYYKEHAKYPFLICYFQTEEAMRHCVNLIGKQGYAIKQLGFIKGRVWETSISTIHRMITDAQIGYGQWFRVEAERVSELDKISSCPHEYMASYKNLKGLGEAETKTWTTSPLMAAIDIETYSHNHRAMPNRDYVSDIVFQCSFILQRLNQPQTRKKTLLVVGPCSNINGAEVVRFDHEIKLIDGLADLVAKENPAILLGYNIFGYDFPYMNARLQLYLRDWKNCGLINDQSTFVNSRTWKSAAYGFMTIAPLEAEGRICIDMYPIIKRDHKLDRYTLDHVSKHFLGRGKHDVSARQMFETYAECRAAEESNQDNRLQAASDAMATVGQYCLEDSTLCIDLLEKLSTWIMLVELATIVCVKLIHIFTQGQQLRVQNQVYQYAYRENFVVDERPGSKDGFKGGHVQDPIPGLYRNILIFDFASLYPSIIRAFNICYTTLVPPESNIPDDMCNVLAWTELDEHKKSPTFGQTLHFRYRFVKKEVFHGILPRMCDHLVVARSATRKLINPKNDPIYNNVLNQRQLGLKVTANSIFGALGVSEGRLPLPEGARSITAMGRVLIGVAADYVREKYRGKIVYGDSVTGDTPILVKRNGLIEWICIRDLCEHPRLAHAKVEVKTQHHDLQVWSDQGWTKVKRLICHKTTKQLYRVLTHTGCVDVTEDHSLLLPDGREVQPHQVAVGTRLLHQDLPALPSYGTLTPEEAWFAPELLIASKETKAAFIQRHTSTSKLEDAVLYHLKADLGLNPLDEQADQIKKIVKLPPTDDYVYDLETDNHHFSAGIGRLVVHNTDSIMVDMEIEDPNECLRIGEMLSQEISKLYPRPLTLEFERGMAIALFIKKKKYAGVPLAIIKLKNGDIIEKLAFDPEFDDPTMELYRFTITRDEKKKVLHIAIPKSVHLNDLIEVGARVEINWPAGCDEPSYRVTQASGEILETPGRKAIVGTPLAAGGRPDEKELMKKGIILARRDNCLWAREAYQRILLSIMFGKPLAYTLNIIDEEVIKMMTRQVPIAKMMVTRAIGSNYKPTSTYPLKIFSDELRRQGHVVQAGDRIDYVFVRNQDPARDEKQGYKMRTLDLYYSKHDLEPLDRVYYVEKSLMNSVGQILYLGYKPELDANEAKCKPEKKKRKKIYTYISSKYVETWVKLIKAKEDLVNTIKYVKPHFTSQDPAFTCNLYDQPPPLELVIVS